MIFNGETKDFIKVLRGRERPLWASRDREIDDFQRLRKTKVETREINVPILILHDGFTDLQSKKEELAEWLVSEEPKRLEFTDEPNRYYMAVVEGLAEHEEFPYWAEAEINFLCPIPYKFGKERDFTVSSSKYKLIEGQLPVAWETFTEFTEDADEYELEIGDLNIILDFGFRKYDELKIDYVNRSVTLNGDDIITALDIRSVWKQLPPKNVKTKATEETKVTYTERYY